MRNGETDAADRASRRAATVLGLALPGDTVLYLLLPLNTDLFGVTLAEAGLLLAANRLVRIAGYGWVARAFQDRGARVTCSVASAAAAAAALGYATLSGVWALLAVRLLWGLAFAGFNIATQALATALPAGAARRSGTSRAIIAAGPMVALVAGALLAETAGPRLVFFLLAAIALAGLPLALGLPAGGADSVVKAGPRFGVPAPLDRWSFVQGMTLDGLFVIGLSVLAAATMPEGAAVAAGTALALRYLAEILLGPVGGIAAERWGAERVLLLASLGTAAGLLVVGLEAFLPGALWVGALAVVTLRGLLQPLPAPVVAARNPGPQRVGALARLATWRDLGAGAGPLLAGVLIPVVPAWAVYGGGAAMLALATVAALRRRLPLSPP